MTTVAEKLTTISNALSAIKQAIIDKGGTVSGNITTYAEAIENITSGTTIISEDVELTRISDDSGNEIGTHFMNFTDNNSMTYKVVCLDASYRKSGRLSWCTVRNSPITDLPSLQNASMWNNTYSATYNCDKILAYCTANSCSSPAVAACRSYSFVIDGATYYGQLPNFRESIYMMLRKNEINDLDPTDDTSSDAGWGHSLYDSPSPDFWISIQNGANQAWYMYGTPTTKLKDSSRNSGSYAYPILEIPLSTNNTNNS